MTRRESWDGHSWISTLARLRHDLLYKQRVIGSMWGCMETGVWALGRALLVMRRSLEPQNTRGGVLWRAEVELTLRSK